MGCGLVRARLLRPVTGKQPPRAGNRNAESPPRRQLALQRELLPRLPAGGADDDAARLRPQQPRIPLRCGCRIAATSFFDSAKAASFRPWATPPSHPAPVPQVSELGQPQAHMRLGYRCSPAYQGNASGPIAFAPPIIARVAGFAALRSKLMPRALVLRALKARQDVLPQLAPIDIRTFILGEQIRAGARLDPVDAEQILLSLAYHAA